MNVLFVVDPLDDLDPQVDASVGLMTAAQALGADIWCCRPEDLAVETGRVQARATSVTLNPRRRGTDHRWLVEDRWYVVQGRAVLDVAASVDLVLLRIDPPVDARYLHATYLLDLVEGAGVPVSNRPAGVRALHEKLAALQFPDLCPDTLVTADASQVRAFVARVGSAVLKPVDGFAGTDVWLLRDDAAALALAESATRTGRRHVIVQRYLDAVARGNKRLFVVAGQLAGAVLRRPSTADFRIGPPYAAAEIDADDARIVEAVGPLLVSNGLHVAGLDVIDGRLIEINVTCPGGMAKADALLGSDLSGLIMRHLLLAERIPVPCLTS